MSYWLPVNLEMKDNDDKAALVTIVRRTSGRANQIASCKVTQVALCICLAVWIALIPAPAYGSQLASPSLAAPVASFDSGRDQPGHAPSNLRSPTEPHPDASVVTYLPDLRTLPLSDLHIQLLSRGRRFLRLENTIWNSGQGPLELTGEFNAATSRTRVHQHIYTADDNRRDVLVGEFVWHPTHDHWHFDEFTLYELWTLTPDYHLGQVVATSDKLSYCVMDTDVVDKDHPHLSLRQGYGGCGQLLQGLSAGWAIPQIDHRQAGPRSHRDPRRFLCPPLDREPKRCDPKKIQQ
jgi:hypothetical protein